MALGGAAGRELWSFAAVLLRRMDGKGGLETEAGTERGAGGLGSEGNGTDEEVVE
jgi:hypothetical protein